MKLAPPEHRLVTNILESIEEKASILKPRQNYFQSPLEDKFEYEIDEFLAYNDEEFFINAFQGILKRSPDTSIFKTLQLLRAGRISKETVLYNLRYSAEGKTKAINVHFLPPRGWAFINKLGRLPILGYILRVAAFLFLIPKLIEEFRALQFKMEQLEAELKKSNVI